MSQPYESISAPPNEPPTVSDECEQRAAHVAILEAWFLAHPWKEITPDELRALVGPNYQQRISNLCTRALDPLCIENVPKWETLGQRNVDGTMKLWKRKLSGSYIFRPQESLGRDPSLPTHQIEMKW